MYKIATTVLQDYFFRNNPAWNKDDTEVVCILSSHVYWDTL